MVKVEEWEKKNADSQEPALSIPYLPGIRGF